MEKAVLLLSAQEQHMSAKVKGEAVRGRTDERRIVVALIGLVLVSTALVHCAGTWAYTFFIILLDGQIAFHEPNRLISIAELGIAVALALAGILFLIIAILELKRNKLIQGSRVCPHCGVKLVHDVEPGRRGGWARVRQLWQCSFAAARRGISLW